MTRSVLRTLALALAIACAVDPGLTVGRGVAPAVDVRSGRILRDGAVFEEVRTRVAKDVRAARPALVRAPDAVVLVDAAAADLERLPEGVPVSFVDTPAHAPVEIVQVTQTSPVLPGQTATIVVELQVEGDRDGEMTVALEQHGLPISEATHRLTGGRERVHVRLRYAPPAAGVHLLRVSARMAGDDRVADAADVAVLGEARRLRVLVYEPRPSWAVTFLRRVLEADPALEVAALARASRGIEVRAGDTPPGLDAGALTGFDAVVVGAPEDLRERDLDALDRFARERGGAVLFQPDRRPSGPYARRLPVAGFDEALLTTPSPLTAGDATVRVAELALPLTVPADAVTLAAVDQAAGPRPVILSWPVGHGRVVFSGALDAWRYRMDPAEGYRRFWSGLVGSLAAAAPRALEIRLDRSAGAPEDPIRITARIRPSELTRGGDGIAAPPVSAALVQEDGTRVFVRLWPAAEAGVFEGAVDAPEPGRHTIHVAAGSRTAAAPLLVANGVIPPRGVDTLTLQRIAAASGGVFARAGELGPLSDHLAGLRTRHTTTAYPMRSGWWLLPLAGLLVAEWALRRRQGLR